MASSNPVLTNLSNRHLSSLLRVLRVPPSSKALKMALLKFQLSAGTWLSETTVGRSASMAIYPAEGILHICTDI